MLHRCTLMIVVLCCGCGGGEDLLRDLPVPELAQAEPAVAERVTQATQAVRDAPGSAAAWGRLGEVLDVNDLPEPALACFARAAELDPAEWRWPYFAGLLARSRDPAAALDHLERAAQLHSGHASLEFHLGQMYFEEREDPDAAERQFRRTLEADTGHVDARLGLARVAVARGDPAAALPWLDEARKIAPDGGAVHVHLAQVYRELDRHADAEREERATMTSSHPARADGFAGMADPVREEVESREGVSSKRMIEKALRLLAAGKPDAAAQAIESALRSHRDSPAVLLTASRVSRSRGDLDQARAQAERALQVDPDGAEAYIELGAVHATAGRTDAAISALQRALVLDPKPPWVKSNLAGLLFQQGRLEEALKLLQDAAADQPGDPEIESKLALVRASLTKAH